MALPRGHPPATLPVAEPLSGRVVVKRGQFLYFGSVQLPQTQG
jgi:hypothetical protein